MTRINVVPPSELHTKHLVAEYRELPRIFGLAQTAFGRGERHDDPRNPRLYTLGTGHVRFFYPKLAFLRDRFASLVSEMLLRGFAPNFTDTPTLDHMPPEWLEGYEPTPEALALNRERIALRMPKP